MSYEKDPNSLEEKIDCLLRNSESTQRERKGERFLSRVDGLYNVLFTLSIFFIGLIISQRSLIAINVILLFPTVGVIFAMLIAFGMGLRGMISNLYDIRIFAWSLLFSCLMWILPVVALVISAPLLNQFSNGLQLTTLIVVLLMGIANFILTRRFTRWIEKSFSNHLEIKIDVWTKIKRTIMIYVLVILAIITILTIIIFLLELTSVIVSLK